MIPCATGDDTDVSRSVAYALDGRYTDFHARLQPFLDAVDESRVQFQVFVDSQPPKAKNVLVNASDVLDVSVAGHNRMEIRVTCEAPNATAILADAYLRHT